MFFTLKVWEVVKKKEYRKSKLINFCLLAVLSISICIVVTPAFANISQNLINQDSTSKIAESQILYERGRFADAVQILQQAVEEYQQQGDTLKQAVALSNLSLAYQQLGHWQKAQIAITKSLNLQEFSQKERTNQNLALLAQSLDIQGRLQLLTGKSEASLATWKNTEDIYTKLEDNNSIALTLLYQAQALRNQGFNKQAMEKLSQINKTLASQGDSLAKAAVFLSLGATLENVGELEKSRLALEQSLEISQRLKSPQNIALSLLSLGNNARIQQKNLQAIALYEKAFEISTSPLTKVQARLNHLNLLIEEKEFAAAQILIPEIQSLLAELPASRPSIYARINFAHSLGSLNTPKAQIAQLLATSVQQARSLDDIRAEAYALGNLGSLYEKTQQFAEAMKLTEQALILAQTSNAPEIKYLWQWQMGRLLKAQGNFTGAIARSAVPKAIAEYDAAIKTLESLRADLVAVNQDIQFNFRDNVEPIYRESVALILQNSGEKPNVKTLDKARTRIEALQLAELDNFFREACLQGERVLLDQLVDKENPNTAILYPIILPEELQVIVKIPQQPLRHHTVKKSQVEVERTLAKLREYILEPDRTEEVQALSQQVYNWLIKPIASDLTTSKVNTLVFVLDGALRNIPLAALYDGEKYLVEKYAVALSLGLGLLAPRPLAQTPVKVLAAGLVQPPPGFPTFPPLPGIKLEFDLIAQTGASTKQLLDQDFTSNTLENNVNTVPFNVLHLATHGQFSSRPEETFILANDGSINVLQFDNLLRSQIDNSRQILELLVLSACQTATGDNRATLGLAGAAIKAGARSTIASLWHINDQSTAILIGEFYNELVNSKVTKAEALRRAQVKLLTEYPNYSRPGYWAAYVLVGNWF
ncbi:CHAT domain-containing protein [Nodularia sphaerocarpa]|uniref:CHAT domain-containing protein n=1 Tax=Nodularia sphaerocarpa TaxID=137816 RepID=UPI001EFAD10B|nr:CHAT domain-containing protein [Nodularia sphaerocarpa]MDB9373354.1 CHAT domain-containing protein [Nodularia sphaerocarpa CS-585]MDB9378810.1 CHAT domain-containing protein [Nodularia sphaerocarpa CS-585A2]